MKMPALDVYAGLCVIESEELAIRVAETLSNEMRSFGDRVRFVFKASYDKANRTSGSSFRGPGLEKGLRILEGIHQRVGVPILTDFHSLEEAMPVAQVVDVLQVPAFLCRQTDVVMSGASAAAKYGRTLNVKKGQFLAPEDTGNIVAKVATVLPKERLMLTERGVSFGYNNLIVDMASFQIMKSFGVRTIFDATHAVQRPGGLGNQTGGKREQVALLSRAAIAAGADGIFLETHPEPDKALSDAATALPLSQVKGLIDQLLRIQEALHAGC